MKNCQFCVAGVKGVVTAFVFYEVVFGGAIYRDACPRVVVFVAVSKVCQLFICIRFEVFC